MKHPRVSIAKDSLRHNETTVKPTMNRRTTRRRTPISYHTSHPKLPKQLLEFPLMKLPKFSGYAIRCWGYMGSIIYHPKLANPTSSCIHPSTHNQENSGNHVPQPSKSIRSTSYGNTPELAPVLGYRGYLTNNCIKEIFDVGVLNSGIPELQ